MHHAPPSDQHAHDLRLKTNGMRMGLLNEERYRQVYISSHVFSEVDICQTRKLEDNRYSRHGNARHGLENPLSALLQSFGGKLGLFFDFDPISLDEHRQDGNALRLRESCDDKIRYRRAKMPKNVLPPSKTCASTCLG